MSQILETPYASEFEDRMFAETPFVEQRVFESQEGPVSEAPAFGEGPTRSWYLETPFLTTEAPQGAQHEAASPELPPLAEITAELKDGLFREALEQLAAEALETHSEQLAAEYGDREARDAAAERLLNDHFYPLASQAESMLDRFFERLEGYETESLTDTEIERIASEVLPTGQPLSPASEQFLGGLLRKAGKLVSGAVDLAKRGVEGAVKLAGKGLSAIGKLALGPLLEPLKKLGKFLLQHVVRFALGQLPPALQPLARKLSDRLFQAIGETSESAFEDHEQTEAEVIPAAADAARLEAEFDVLAAQLLLVPDEAEADHLVSSYGEQETPINSLAELDNARSQLTTGLRSLESGESAQPIMEQFLPALIWPAAKTAITLMGRPKLVEFLGRLLSSLIRPMIGAEAAGLLAPSIADAGLRIFGLETESGQPDSRAVVAEALAATVEETINRVAELPPHVLENETLVESAVRESFDEAAATYFPSAHIKADLRQTADHNGMWTRMPLESHRKRYAKYSAALPVTITPRGAEGVPTYGGATLQDHIRDRIDVPTDRPLQTNLRLYQAIPGTTISTIARAEGIRPQDLHPLTPNAAGSLLGPNAALGNRRTPPCYLASANRLHLRQRLYYIEPPGGPHHHRRPHARLARSEMLVNLRKGELRAWLYLSEPLCQRVAGELAKAGNVARAFLLLRPLVLRTAEIVRTMVLERHMPMELRIIGETPNLEQRVPAWLIPVGRHLSAKVAEWLSHQLTQYLRNNAAEFRRVSTSQHDGLTIRITMSNVPGMESLRLMSQGKVPKNIQGTAWLRGQPAFSVVTVPGYAIR